MVQIRRLPGRRELHLPLDTPVRHLRLQGQHAHQYVLVDIHAHRRHRHQVRLLRQPTFPRRHQRLIQLLRQRQIRQP